MEEKKLPRNFDKALSLKPSSLFSGKDFSRREKVFLWEWLVGRSRGRAPFIKSPH